MIKTILVTAYGSDADVATYETALAVARQFGAHLDVLHVEIDPVELAVAMTTEAPGAGALTQGSLDQLEEDTRERTANALQAYTSFCERNQISTTATPGKPEGKVSAEWHVERGQETRWLSVYGLTADLIIAPRGGGDDVTPRSVLETTLTEAGRPILVPSASAVAPTLADTVAIAWKPVPSASRAVAAAMPFITRAKNVVVLTIAEGDRADGDDGADRLVRALAWHGVTATVQRLTAGDDGAPATLLSAAGSTAGLLVMGGYGHSQLREWIFGGFTQHVLADAPLPVLLAH